MLQLDRGNNPYARVEMTPNLDRKIAVGSGHPGISANGVRTNMGNWYEHNVLEEPAKHNVSAIENPIHLGNWYEA